MKKMLKDKTSNWHLYLLRPLVILLSLSLVFAPVSAEMDFEMSRNQRSVDIIYSSDEEEAKDALLQIQSAQNAYFLEKGKYFISDDILEINNVLGLSLNEAYWDYKTGDVASLLGQADTKDSSNLGFRIKQTGQPYCYNGCYKEEFTPPILGVSEVYTQLADVALQTGGAIHSSPVMVNLDAEPKGELIVGSDDGKIYAWKYNGSQWVGFFDLSPNGLFADTTDFLDGSAVISTPAVADINNDGIKEVVIGTVSGNIYVFKAQDSDSDGRADLLLRKSLGDNIENSLVLDDIDGDTYDEIIALGSWGTFGIWNHDGTLYAYIPDSSFAEVFSSPAVGNVDPSDSNPEIVEAYAAGYLYVWKNNGAPFNPQGRADGAFAQINQLHGEIWSSPALADIDGDGFLEIIIGTAVVGTDQGYLYAFNHDGTKVEPLPPSTTINWPKPVGSRIKSSPAIANIAPHSTSGYAQYDQDLEIVVGSNNGKVHAYHHDGTAVAGWPVNRGSANPATHDSSPTIANIDDVGRPEVIIGGWNNTENASKLYAYDYTGGLVFGWPKDVSPNYAIDLSAPSIGLLAHPSFLDVAIGSTNGTVYLWELNGQFAEGGLPWPKFRADLKNTGTYLRSDRNIPTTSIEYITPATVNIGENIEFHVLADDSAGIFDISDYYDIPVGAAADFTYTSGNNSGTFTWPSTDITGIFRPYFIATDQNGLHSQKREVEITVNPVAIDDNSYPPILEDHNLSVPAPGVLSNDRYTGSATAVLVSPPTHYLSFNLNLNGLFNYTPALNWSGTDSFQYKVVNGVLESAFATVTITVTAVNDAPVLANMEPGALSYNEGDPAKPITDTITVTDVDSSNLSGGVVQITSGYESGYDLLEFTNQNGITGSYLNGTMTLTGSATVLNYQTALRSVTYRNTSASPSPSPRTVTFKVSDDLSADSNIANRTINMNAVPDAPTLSGIPDRITDEEIPLDNTIDLWDYAADAETPDSGLIFTITANTDSRVGVSIDPADGHHIDINPASNFFGSSDVTIKVTDPGGLYAEDPFRITVNQRCDDPPTIVPDSYSTDEDTVLNILPVDSVLNNDTNNEDGTNMTAVIVTNPSHAQSFTLNSDGIFAYTPNPNWSGIDSFRYKARSRGGVCDTDLDSAEATVTITVTQKCDDAPTALENSYSTDEDTALNIIDVLLGVLGNDTNNESGTTMTAVIVTNPSHAKSFTFNSNGSFVYEPADRYNGPDWFRYKARSSCGIDSAAVFVFITVNPISARLYNDDSPTRTLIKGFPTIQEALDYAGLADNNIIEVERGLYEENLLFTRNISITVRSEDGPTKTTIIGGGANSVITFSQPTKNVALEGFTIKNGKVTGDGGGIKITNSPVTITNCIITENTASGNGGGIWINNAPVTIIECKVTNNTATDTGGGIYINSDKPVYINSKTEILNNSAGNVKSRGMYVAGSGRTTVSDCKIKTISSGGGSCLLAGTKISMAGGTMKAIEKVVKGDMVLGIDKDNKITPSEVTETFYHPHRQGFYIIETEDGNILKVTGNHPLYNGKDFIEAEKFKVDDEILVVYNKDKRKFIHSKITKMTKVNSIVDVYNLEVDKHHTYFAEGVVVHNKITKRLAGQ